MARMIPAFGPQDTESPGEVLLYDLIAKGLSDDFTVIHSLPWLCAAVKEIDAAYAPTGEIDFLVIHQELGILALEVKSGRYRVEGVSFIHLKTDAATAPIQQARRNVHGLAKWLGSDPALRFRIGYGLIFPDSDFGDALISAALVDPSVKPPESIMVDKRQVPELAKRIEEIMRFWRAANRTSKLPDVTLRQLLDVLCPNFDGTPTWATRVLFDNKIWLPLTGEQSKVVASAHGRKRMVITGWPGTGKTLIGIALAREMVARGKRVLVLTFNSLLTDYLARQTDFKGTEGFVSTWHGLCVLARKKLGITDDLNRETWYRTECVGDLKAALAKSLIEDFDVLILDEAQALRPEWCELLIEWFQEKQIVAFCDETQVFSFETGTTNLRDLCDGLEVDNPFVLTIALRTPKAVTERLLSVKPISYQLTSPRQDEPDTVQERVVTNLWSALMETVLQFKAHDLDERDIVVLSKFGLNEEALNTLLPLGVASETVSRFRGLEAPAVIVFEADCMDDAELFCAYSRATTVCVALYDAEALGWGVKGGFQKRVMAIDGNRAFAEKARSDSQAGTILRSRLELDPVGIESVRLDWNPTWGAWMVEVEDIDDPGILWVDYLVSHYKWPAYFWGKNSCRVFHHAEAVESLSSEVGGTSWLKLTDCDVCNCATPHSNGSSVVRAECIYCSGREQRHTDRPGAEILGRLKSFDIVLQNEDLKQVTVSQIQALPLSLAAFGARKYAARKALREVDNLNLPFGRILYRAALFFVQSRIQFLPEGRQIVVGELAGELHERYDEIRGTLALADWQRVVASAVATCFQKQLLTKVRKGTYLPTGKAQGLHGAV